MASGIDLSWSLAVGLMTFAFGIACGIGIAYLMPVNRRRTQELQEKLQNLQQEFDSYHDQVGQHFQQTSELVQKMTESYRDVYEHLATGSQRLCQTPINTPRLDIPEQPTLEAATQPHPTDQETLETFPDAQPEGLDDQESDDILGDAPRVPKLDSTNEKSRSNSPAA